jgi:hypothetical protein
LAAGIQTTAKTLIVYIIYFAYHELVSHCPRNSQLPSTYPLSSKWDARRFSALVGDPFTDPLSPTITSTRTKKDLGRMNSVVNWIQLCWEHDNRRFSIRPDVRMLFPCTISNLLLSRLTKYVHDKSNNVIPDLKLPYLAPRFEGNYEHETMV